MDDPPDEDAKATETETGPKPAPEPRDDDGLPVGREATLDDVRGGGSGRSMAIGCTVLVIAAVAAFWVLRTLL